MWREVPAAAGGPVVLGRGVNEWRVRECVGRRRALAVASEAVF